VLRPGKPLPPITITNETRTVFRVRAYPALVRQNLDGSLAIRERPAALTAARRLFALHPGRLLLRPGRRATVGGRFVRAPAGAVAAYAAAVVEATPAKVTHGPRYRLRLLGALLVAIPGAPPPRAAVESLRVRRVSPRRLHLVARLRNTGPVHGYPSDLRLRLRDRRARTIFVGRPRPGVLLPGARRDYGVFLFRRLRAGRYSVQASGSFGPRAFSRSVRFRVAP
jgi:hypothetical protein